MASDRRPPEQRVDPATVSEELLVRFEAGSREPFRPHARQPDERGAGPRGQSRHGRPRLRIGGRRPWPSPAACPATHEIEAPSSLAGLVSRIGKLSDAELAPQLRELQQGKVLTFPALGPPPDGQAGAAQAPGPAANPDAPPLATST
jgi:hypothetical protein